MKKTELVSAKTMAELVGCDKRTILMYCTKGWIPSAELVGEGIFGQGRWVMDRRDLALVRKLYGEGKVGPPTLDRIARREKLLQKGA